MYHINIINTYINTIYVVHMYYINRFCTPPLKMYYINTINVYINAIDVLHMYYKNTFMYYINT